MALSELVTIALICAGALVIFGAIIAVAFIAVAYLMMRKFGRM
jgi:predicted RecA/RadA family phage recombinase